MSSRVQLNWFNEELARRAAAIEAGEVAPAAARDAATVMLVRPAKRAHQRGVKGGSSPRGQAGLVRPASPDGVEVLMMERPAAMSFAAGAYVFPGGRVDAVDADPATGWHGPSPAEFGVVLGASPDVARALVCAAVRETFEEAGVLLAGTPESVAVPSGPDWEADRTALTSGSATLGDLLARRGLVLRADLLIPWARWITPAAEPKRFDARFFTALLPSGQEAVRHEAEAERIVWLRPEDAIESARAGSMMLLPPTATTLNEFAALGDVAAILRQRRTITPIQPRITVLDGGQAWVEIPGDVPYPL